MMHEKLSLPNKITIFRLILLPVFIALILHYRRFEEGQGEWLRWLAVGVFALAMISDAVDGYIARVYQMRTPLGSFLDPAADKLLLNAAIITLCLRPIALGYPSFNLPIWYAVLVLSRDLTLGLGTFLVYMTTQTTIKPQPVLMGKLATILNMCVVVWALLKCPGVYLFYYPDGICTFISGIQYIYNGLLQVNQSGRNGTTTKEAE